MGAEPQGPSPVGLLAHTAALPKVGGSCLGRFITVPRQVQLVISDI